MLKAFLDFVFGDTYEKVSIRMPIYITVIVAASMVHLWLLAFGVLPWSPQ